MIVYFCNFYWCFIMWGVTLFFLFCVAAQVTSHNIEVKCEEYHGFPPGHETLVPSLVAGLELKMVPVGERVMLNISWAISIDASTKYLTATRIRTERQDYHCNYNPSLASASLDQLEKIWFHYAVNPTYGYNIIQVANLPFPPLVDGNLVYVTESISIPKPPKTTVTPTSPYVTTVKVTTGLTTPAPRVIVRFAIIFTGGVVILIILSSFCIMYKNRTVKAGKLLDYQNIPVVPPHVLLVYPAVNSAFQRAVVALAEFLQLHGGCKVAIDIWQQEKIAQKGPMRWLAEEAKSANQVLIVSPQPSHCPPDPSMSESSIPAAAHDLYPLILNMVASNAKNPSELSKFWVVQLGEQKDKSSCMLPLELRVCKTFCLMKDLKKLYKGLHTCEQIDKKIISLICNRGVSYSENSTLTLRESVETLRGHQVNISKDVTIKFCDHHNLNICHDNVLTA
uniref:Interleukin 17 receptor B n=1 Tax=Haplochromis burtoni TaxID=8153 RepID=A0A3Q2V0D6_HAPBU